MRGLALGLSVATLIGYGLAKSPLLERILSPYIVASQAVPIVALAPLLVIWFGFGGISKVLVCALTVFFPSLVNTIVGIRSVEPDLRALMRSLQATRWQTFAMLEVPAALPIFFGGLKVSVTLAVIGAVVGEFVGADRGLGFLDQPGARHPGYADAVRGPVYPGGDCAGAVFGGGAGRVCGVAVA